LLPDPASDEQVADQMMTEYKDKWAVAKAKSRGLLEKLKQRALSGSTSAIVPAAAIATNQAINNVVFALVTFLEEGTVQSLNSCIGSLENWATVVKYSRVATRAAWVLQAGILGYEFYYNINQWWKGEIDGVACSKGCTSALASAGAGIGAGFLCGAAFGIPGAIIGGIAAGIVAGQISDFTFDLFAGDDRYRSLSRAYAKLGLAADASHEDVRKTYIQLARTHHPDKGGNKVKFIEINAAYELIRASRINSD